MIALTFDDGPWYDTPQFLHILEHYHVHATFFEIGEQISTYGQGGAIERRMLADGDMVGDHTWSHPNVAAGGSFARNQIQEAAAAISQATHGFYPVPVPRALRRHQPGADLAGPLDGLHGDPVGRRSARLGSARHRLRSTTTWSPTPIRARS